MELGAYLREHPDIKLAFQPGTLGMQLVLKVCEAYLQSNRAFSECKKQDESLESLMTWKLKNSSLRPALGPKIVVITDGPKGAYPFKQKEIWFMPPYPDPKPPFERTGAGDAFASTFTAALALGMSIPQALSWGPINSMSVQKPEALQRSSLPCRNWKIITRSSSWIQTKLLS